MDGMKRAKIEMEWLIHAFGYLLPYCLLLIVGWAFVAVALWWLDCLLILTSISI